MEFVISFAISLALTALVYGIGPLLLLAFHQSTISPKKLKWFHIIYTIVVSLAFNVLAAMLGYRCNFTPALIWGTIFYRINKKKFAQREKAIPPETYAQQEAQMKQFVVDDATGEVISEPPVEDPKPVVLSYAPDFKLSGPPQPIVEPAPQDPPAPPSAPKKNSALYGVLIALCVASLAGNAVQGYLFVRQQHNAETVQSELQKELSEQKKLVGDLKKVRSNLLKEISDMQDNSYMQDGLIDMIAPKAFALDTYIGFIYDGSNYCHAYDCPQFPFEDCDEFTAHNVEYCEWLGYPKHSKCWN